MSILSNSKLIETIETFDLKSEKYRNKQICAIRIKSFFLADLRYGLHTVLLLRKNDIELIDFQCFMIKNNREGEVFKYENIIS